MTRYLDRLKQAEVVGLYMLIFFLPFLKVPKNIGLFIFIFAALSWRALDKNIHWRKPDTFELLLIAFALVAAVSTTMNWPFPKGISGFKDSLTITAIGLIVYNSQFNSHQIKTLIYLFLCGATIGLGYGYYEYHTGISSYFEFKNMSVAETATITGIALAITLSMMLDTTSALNNKKKLIYGTFSLIFISCLTMMGNRSGILGFSVFFLYFLIFNIKNYKTYTPFIAIAIITITAVFLTSESFSNRINHILSTEITIASEIKFNSNDSHRFQHWQLALLQYQQGEKKLFGIGPRNFQSINIETLNEKSRDLKIKSFEHLHAHNMYLNKLAEEGLFGLIVLIALLGFSMKILFSRQIQNNHWLTTAGSGALIIPMIAGIFYAPYSREIAWVSILFVTLAIHTYKNPHQNLKQ